MSLAWQCDKLKITYYFMIIVQAAFEIYRKHNVVVQQQNGKNIWTIYTLLKMFSSTP